MTFMKISIFEYFNIKLLPKTVILMNFLITIDVWQAAKYLKVLENLWNLDYISQMKPLTEIKINGLHFFKISVFSLFSISS